MPGGRARGAKACTELSKRDAVIAVCLQNDFMDERDVEGAYARALEKADDETELEGAAYEIPARALTNDGFKVRRGTLAVGNGHEVIRIANAWLKRGSERGARLLVTKDYHPRNTAVFANLAREGSVSWTVFGDVKGLKVCVSLAQAFRRMSLILRIAAWTISRRMTLSKVDTSSGPHIA